MTKIYITNQPMPGPNGYAYDVSSAQQFGEIVYVFGPSTPRPSITPRQAWEHCLDVMRDAEPGDYICAAGGDPLGTVMASAAIDRLTDGRFNYLRWNRGRDGAPGYYSELTLNLLDDETE